MKNIIRASVMGLVMSALSLAPVPLSAQSSAPAPTTLSKLDLGLTYSAKFIKVNETSGPWQVVNGVSADGVYNLGPRFRHFGLAADLTYESSDAIKPGVNLKQFTVVAGPRYTLKSKAGATFYAESLFGYVHAFNSVFPSGQTVSSTANSFAMQAGGGASLPFNKTFGWRIFALDYIGTWLPNNSDNYQGDIRVSTGLTFHF